MALDVVDEKMRQAGVSTAKDDMYLGFLGPIEDYRVYVAASSSSLCVCEAGSADARLCSYGYVTNTAVKFVAIIQDSPVRESELRTVREALL